MVTADRGDRDHAACRELPEGDEGQPEVAGLGTADWQHIQDLAGTYAGLRPGGTDASVTALAERTRATPIAALNRRHFAVVRPRHTSAFELLPG